jgi:hypothetical protein
MTRGGSSAAGNRAERVATCHTCGLPILAVGARGPLPTRHPECRPATEQLLYQIRSAARLAHTIGRQTIGRELDALAAVLMVAEAAPAIARRSAASVAIKADAVNTVPWTRLGE